MTRAPVCGYGRRRGGPEGPPLVKRWLSFSDYQVPVNVAPGVAVAGAVEEQAPLPGLSQVRTMPELVLTIAKIVPSLPLVFASMVYEVASAPVATPTVPPVVGAPSTMLSPVL